MNSICLYVFGVPYSMEKVNSQTFIIAPNQRAHVRRNTSAAVRCWKVLVRILLALAVLTVTVWCYMLQVDFNGLHKVVQQTHKVSITHDTDPFIEKELLRRGPRAAGQPFQFIHLGANDGSAPNMPPEDNVILPPEVPITKWAMEETTDSKVMAYNKATGEVTVHQPGFYHVYAQVRLSQQMKMKGLVTFSISVNGIKKGIAIWNDIEITQRLSLVVKLVQNDRVSIRMGRSQMPIQCYCKKNFTFFGMYLVS